MRRPSTCEALVEAVVSCRPILPADDLREQLPGVEAVGIAVRSHRHVLQFDLDISSKSGLSGAPRTSIFPPSSPCLANEVAALGKSLACSSSKCALFADAATLIGDGPCESVACVALTDAGAPPFGALTVAFRSGVVPRDAALAIHALARALGTSSARQRLQRHGDALMVSLLTPPHPLEEPAAAAAGPSTPAAALSAACPPQPPLADACCAAAAADVAPAPVPPSPTASTASSESGRSAASGAHPAEEQHALWLTFRSPAVERNYAKWAAMHMRHLDPAATLFSCSYFVAMGVSPSFAMALRHPAAWAAGWAALLPMALGLLPPTARFYLARREACLAAFHALALAWHVATLNGTALLGPSLFAHVGDSPVACLSWQAVNLLMFQMRWWQLVAVAAAMFAADVVPAAAPMCGVFDAAGLPQGGRCAARVVALGAVQLVAALGVLRVNERRMRRLFLEHLAEPPAKQRANFWFLQPFKLLSGIPVAVEVPRGGAAPADAGWKGKEA